MSQQGKAIIKKIIQSESFGNSKVYADLLRYLYTQTQAGEIPKEITISVQFFKEDTSSSYSNSKVRVYIHNLRKKLKQYYKHEGKQDAYVLSIPSGSYAVEIQAREVTPSPAPIASPQINSSTLLQKPQSLLVLFATLLLCSLLANAWLWQSRKKVEAAYQVVPPSPFWKEFIEDDRPILLVVGDLIIFREYDSLRNKSQTVRLPGVNSMTQFETYKEAHAGEGIILSPITYTYLIKNSLPCVQRLTRLFMSYQKDFNIRVNTRLQAKDLHDYNIIFMGMQKTAGIFNNYFSNSAFHYGDDQYTYQASDTARIDTFRAYGSPDHYHTDYGFVAKFPGPSGNTIITFGGLWDTAVAQTLKNYTEPPLISKMEAAMQAEWGEIPPHFEVFFEVSGMDRVELDTKILQMNQMEDFSKVWSMQEGKI